ncbi:MAG: hypothetical protein EOO02_09210, partial [Chitinophagaceae bacterium]
MKLSLIFLLIFCTTGGVFAQVKFDIEGGVVFGTNYNDVRVPGTTGTLFDANKALKAKAKVFYRLRAGYTFAKRHTISVLYAPLTVRYDGNFDQDVNFVSQVFTRDKTVRFDYQFNSYRLTYRYDF